MLNLTVLLQKGPVAVLMSSGFTLVVVLLVMLLITVYLNLKVRTIRRELALTKFRHDEVEFQLQRRNEKIVGAEREKSEMLSKIDMLERELGEKNQALALLGKEQKELIDRITIYSQRLETVERKNYEIKMGLASPSLFQVTREINSLLEKRNIPKKEGYDKLLATISPLFFEELSTYSNLSYNYLKYCVCFAIDMDINDVAQSFSVEPSTVHMIRYRLKRKFSFDKDQNLNLFLKKIARKDSAVDLA